jgi:hypothetical protein
MSALAMKNPPSIRKSLFSFLAKMFIYVSILTELWKQRHQTCV